MEQLITQSIDLTGSVGQSDSDAGSDTVLISDVVFVKFKLNDSDQPIHKLLNISSVNRGHKIVVGQLRNPLKYQFPELTSGVYRLNFESIDIQSL